MDQQWWQKQFHWSGKIRWVRQTTPRLHATPTVHPQQIRPLKRIHANKVPAITRKMVPITGRAGSFLEIFCLKTPISIQIKSKLYPNQIKSFFCSSFFLCLQGQPELCCSYHLPQSCFSFFIRLHGQPEPFGSYIFSSLALLSCSVSTANLSCLLATTFSSLSFLSNSFSSPLFIF